MLSRSNSNAGERLRRAKSTSSAHTTSSGHQRSSTSIDPFVTRQHAETAAVEAFQRAKKYEEPATLQAYRPVPPKLQRRKSQGTGRTQGSHFEDARLGRRRSTSKKSENRAPKTARSQCVASEAPASTSETSEGEVVITRKRSFIPPGPTPRYSLYDPSFSTSAGRTERRRSQTTYTEGSPVPRNVTATQTSSTDNRATPLSRHTQHDSSFAGFDGVDNGARSLEDSTQGTQADEVSIAFGNGHGTAGSQSHKLRERKSIFLAPFQRRRGTNNSKPTGHGYDTTLPPFNYADEGLLPPVPHPPPTYTAPELAVVHEKKNRTISDSLKGRFRKVFRKATRVPTILPAQQVEATRLHLPVTTPLSTPTVQLQEPEDPFTNVGHRHDSYLPVPDPYAGSSSRHSSSEQSAAKSRVTSWTNSTVAGTWSTRDDVADNDDADEHGRLKRSDSTSTLRKAKSFFGRPVKSKLRRSSKLDLSGSRESADLYTALQERIQPGKAATEVPAEDDTQSVRVPSALDSLPSRRTAESVSSRSGWHSSTIRSVTPDPTAYRLDIPSPVEEVLSPEAGGPSTHVEAAGDEATPRSQLRRRPAMKAPTPSKEQLERRMERCKNRWQSPLDELSPSAPRPTRHMMEENPYEMRSLSRTLQQSVANDLPHHARVGEQQANGRSDVLSPSVYSRATDGDSPRPNTPATTGGMVVTITGREVKSYAISPSKVDQPAERPIHASQDWRRWLSDEMNGWDGSSAPQDFALPKGILKGSVSEPQGNTTQQRKPSGRDEPRSASASPVLEPPQTQIKTKEQRPRPSSRLSSYMNDRYPMIDTGRNSSDQSIGRRSRISSHAESRADTRASGTPAEGDNRQSAVEGRSLKSALSRQRVVTKPKSFAQLASTLRAETPADEEPAKDDHPKPASSSPAPSNPASKPPAPTKRPKSAFDLRANYKSRITSAARPLEVRRKGHNATDNTTHHVLEEDSTILGISAGPYATASSPLAAAEDKENIAPPPHPASEPAGLPALSSSEWLAAGTVGRKRDGLGVVHPALRERERKGVRYEVSRSREGTPTAGGGGGAGGGSPGHRLASSWLEGRRSKEGSPAFV